MSSQEDTERRSRPVVALIAFTLLIIGTLAACPALIDAGPVAASATVVVASAGAHDHENHHDAESACGTAVADVPLAPACYADRSGPGPLLAVFPAPAAADPSSSASLGPDPARGVPAATLRSGRVLLNDLVIARI